MGCSHEYIKRSDVGCFLFLSCGLSNYMGDAVKERKIKTPVEYIHEKVGAAMFQIEGGMYSIDELEQMVADFKQATAIMDKHLERSMQEIKRVMR